MAVSTGVVDGVAVTGASSRVAQGCADLTPLGLGRPARSYAGTTYRLDASQTPFATIGTRHPPATRLASEAVVCGVIERRAAGIGGACRTPFAFGGYGTVRFGRDVAYRLSHVSWVTGGGSIRAVCRVRV